MECHPHPGLAPSRGKEQIRARGKGLFCHPQPDLPPSRGKGQIRARGKGLKRRTGVWIPACAGMTGRAAKGPAPSEGRGKGDRDRRGDGGLDSRLRGNDGGSGEPAPGEGWGKERAPSGGRGDRDEEADGGLDSRLRGNDGREELAGTEEWAGRACPWRADVGEGKGSRWQPGIFQTPSERHHG